MAKSSSEKLKAIIEKLKKLKHILSRLAFYRQEENEIDAEVDSGNLTQEKANRLKIMIRLQKAKEQLSDLWLEASLEGIRSEISTDLVPLEDFIIEKSLDGDNELLKKIYETIRDSEESQEIQNLIVDFQMICQRAEKKSGTQLKEPPEKPPAPETTDEIIEIKIYEFSKCQSKQLLRDLALCPSGVKHNPKQHGKKQPGTLKERLKDQGYAERDRKCFHKRGEYIICDKKIKLIEKNNTP